MASGSGGSPNRHGSLRGIAVAIVVIAAVVGVCWLLFLIIGAIAGRAGDFYHKVVRLPALPHELFWGMLGIYGVVVGLVVGVAVVQLNDANSRLGLLMWAIAAAVIPPALLLVPVHDQAVPTGVPTLDQLGIGQHVEHCGSFYAQQSSEFECVQEFNSRSRWAVTIAAIAIIGPMGWLYLEAHKEDKQRKSGDDTTG